VKNISKSLVMQRTAYVFVLFLALAAIPPALLGQRLGAISGTVTDPTGAVISAPAVTATQADTGTMTEVKTNERGSYVFPSLPPASYSISVTATGFKKYALRAFSVHIRT
jgi:hypothetical protein